MIEDSLKRVGLTSDGRAWYQLCYVCRKQIDFLKTPKNQWLSVGQGLIRHAKCRRYYEPSKRPTQ